MEDIELIGEDIVGDDELDAFLVGDDDFDDEDFEIGDGMTDEDAIMQLIGEDDDFDDDYDDLVGEDEIDWVGDDYEPTSAVEVGRRRGRGGLRRVRRFLNLRKKVAQRARRKAKARLKNRLRRKAVKKILSRRRLVGRGKRQVAVKRRQGRVLIIGGQVVATAAGSFDASTTVQELCRIDRIFTSALDGGGAVVNPNQYFITDIKVGTRSQFAALPPIPAVIFQADATAHTSGLMLDTVQPGTDFTVRFQVPAAGTFRFGCFASSLR